MRGAGSERRLVGFATVVSYAGDHLRKAVIETAGPSGAILQLLTEAREKMEQSPADPPEDNPQGRARRLAARCWAMLLASHRRRRDCVAIHFNQVDPGNEWPDMDQTAGAEGETWN